MATALNFCGSANKAISHTRIKAALLIIVVTKVDKKDSNRISNNFDP